MLFTYKNKTFFLEILAPPCSVECFESFGMLMSCELLCCVSCQAIRKSTYLGLLDTEDEFNIIFRNVGKDSVIEAGVMSEET